MRITLLGTGTPMLDPERQQSTLLVESGRDKLVFDTGRGVTTQLAKIGLAPQQIDSVFITHHHYDHICDLGEFLLTAWHNDRTEPIHVYGPQGTRGIVAALFDQVFARDIAFTRRNEPDIPDILKLVQVQDVTPGLVCETDTWKVSTAYVEHGSALGLSRDEWPCLGYRIEAENKIVAISGDTVACAGLDTLAQGADCLIQCCYRAEAELTNPAAALSAKQVIASAGQAGEIAARNKVKKLVLTHIRYKPQAMMQTLVADVRRAYQGEVIVGEDLTVIEV